MKIPKVQKLFCPYCGRHTEHTVEQSKKKNRRKMSQGQRRFLEKLKGYGSFPRAKPDHQKPTKRTDLRYKCSECKKKHTKGKGFRSKKFQIVKV